MTKTEPKWLAHSPNTSLNLFPSTSSPRGFSLALEVGREKHPGKSALGTRLFFPANAGVTYNNNRDLRIRRRRRQRERQKSSRLKLAKQQLCTCITLFCTFLCRRCTTTTWKCLISRFMEDVNVLSWIWFLGIELLESSSTFDKVSELELSRWRLNEREFTFYWCFRCRCRPRILRSLIISTTAACSRGLRPGTKSFKVWCKFSKNQC